MSELVREVAFDLEWVALIKKAKELGMTKEEVREFLKTWNDKGGGNKW